MVEGVGRARLLVVAAALAFSTGGVAIKACSLSGWQVASFRSGLAALFLLAFAPSARRLGGWRQLTVGMAYAATMVLFVLANKLTTAANAIFLQSTAPLHLLILSPWLTRERVRHRDLPVVASIALGLLLFFAGASEMQRTAPDPVAGNIIAALAGVSWALTLLGLRGLSRGGEGGGLAAVTGGNIIAFLVALPAALTIDPMPMTAGDAGLLVYLGVVQTGIAYIALTRGFRRVPAFEASVLIVIEPALSPLWAWMVHGERPRGEHLFGGGLIVGAAVFKSWLDTRRCESEE
ncbi:MAG: EamA family transporter [Myxococcota bacterium]